MDVIFRKNATDADMIDIVGPSGAGTGGKEILWGVVHADFLYGVGGALEEVFKANDEVLAQIDAKS
ncbi:hypothetical protein KAR91_02050 [Candidatus Pacearchaeota archaeon]|nr:hypothetical protein [Candidatus Pacearchaeota archaeon]